MEFRVLRYFLNVSEKEKQQELLTFCI